MYTFIYTLFIVPSFRAQYFSHSYLFGSSWEAKHVKSKNNAKRKSRMEGTPEYAARQAKDLQRIQAKYGKFVDAKIEPDEAESALNNESQGDGRGACQGKGSGNGSKGSGEGVHKRGKGGNSKGKKSKGKGRAAVRANPKTKEGICTI